MIQVPFIEKGALTGRYQCVTKYKVVMHGSKRVVESLQQFDIHQQIMKIVEQEIKARCKRRKRKPKAKPKKRASKRRPFCAAP